MKPEMKLSLKLAEYIQEAYPTCIYHFDTGSGSKLTQGAAKRNKRLNKWNGYPDLFIAEPRGDYAGLYIELKAVEIFKVNGELKKSNHLNQQRHMLKSLRTRGYYATWGIGIDSAMKIIDEYLSLPKPKINT